MTQVNKPALLRRLFELACKYSGQILSFTKMLGQLQEAGNTTTLAHYLDLLEGAGLVAGLPRYAGDVARQRGSSPKLLALNTALMTAQSGLTLAAARADPEYWRRLVETAVGAHLANSAAVGGWELSYWRDRDREVDYVTEAGPHLTAYEVKSVGGRETLPGMAAFKAPFEPKRTLLVGGTGLPLEEFLLLPAEHWALP